MKLDTIEKAKDFVIGLGVMEFVFITENIATYRTPIPIMVDDMLTDYEVLFFVEECDTFYRMDSFNDFLSSLSIFEIKEVCEELNESEILYHRKYNSNEIINSEKDVLRSMKLNFISIDDLLGHKDESDIDKCKRMLHEFVDKEDYINASIMRDKIKQLESV